MSQDECEVDNQSKVMLQSNSVNLNFCFANKLKNKKNEYESVDVITICVDTSDNQYSSTTLSENLISFMVINPMDSAVNISIQEYFIPFIQEAMDSNGIWRPIEYWLNWSCGNAYQQMNLGSGESMRYPIRKYEGDFKTKIRIKAKINNQIYYSKPFNGSINHTQMDISFSEKSIRISKKKWKELKTDPQFIGLKRKNIREGKSIPAAPDFLD